MRCMKICYYKITIYHGGHKDLPYALQALRPLWLNIVRLDSDNIENLVIGYLILGSGLWMVIPLKSLHMMVIREKRDHFDSSLMGKNIKCVRS